MKFRIFNKNRNINEISAHEIKDILKSFPNAILLDVRSIQEYNEGHLPGAINIPIYDLEEKANKVLEDKNLVIIAYCSAGIRSKNAVRILRKLGYNNLYNLKGGMPI